jgi:hypothetical protein
VANSGLSVSRDDVDRLFQPFERLGNDRTTHPGGHGLGLSIVRAVVTAHDAGLKIQLRPGGGLVVQVFFPLSSVGVNDHRATAGSARHSAPSKSRFADREMRTAAAGSRAKREHGVDEWADVEPARTLDRG